MEIRQQRINALIERRRRELLAWYRDCQRPEVKERQRLSTPAKADAGGLLTGCGMLHVEAKTRNKLTEKVITA